MRRAPCLRLWPKGQAHIRGRVLEWVRVLVRGHMVSVNVCRTRHSLTLGGGEGKFFLAHLIASTSQETFPHGFFPALLMQLSYSVWHCLYEKVYRKGSIHCSFTDSRYFKGDPFISRNLINVWIIDRKGN